MNFTIRLASVVALFTFWLATIGWTVLIVAAPANAAPSNEHGAASTSMSAPAGGAGKSAHLTPSVKPQPEEPPANVPQPVEPPAKEPAAAGEAAAAPTLGTTTTSGARSSEDEVLGFRESDFRDSVDLVQH